MSENQQEDYAPLPKALHETGFDPVCRKFMFLTIMNFVLCLCVSCRFFWFTFLLYFRAIKIESTFHKQNSAMGGGGGGGAPPAIPPPMPGAARRGGPAAGGLPPPLAYEIMLAI